MTAALESGSTLDSIGSAEELVALSNDVYAGDVPPWRFATTSQFDGMATHASVRSNLWPGAFAVAHGRLVGITGTRVIVFYLKRVTGANGTSGCLSQTCNIHTIPLITIMVIMLVRSVIFSPLIQTR